MLAMAALERAQRGRRQPGRDGEEPSVFSSPKYSAISWHCGAPAGTEPCSRLGALPRRSETLGMFWAGSGELLGRFCACSGHIPGSFWPGSGHILGRFWARSGPVLGRVRPPSLLPVPCPALSPSEELWRLRHRSHSVLFGESTPPAQDYPADSHIDVIYAAFQLFLRQMGRSHPSPCEI